MTDLHCDKRLHGKFAAGVLEIHCRWCSSAAGHPVLHRWELDEATGDFKRVADRFVSTHPNVRRRDALRLLEQVA